MTNTYSLPEYVLIEQHVRLWRGYWVLKHVEKPSENLNKWHYDSKSDTYYRIRTAWGIGNRIRIK